MSLLPGTRLGPYEIVAPLGAGGMGEVVRARDTRLGREVAIKSLPAAFARDPERLARFEREAKLLASLSHPNIAGIHGLEQMSGASYLVLEFVDGETLAKRLARGPLPLDEGLDVARQIAAGVEAAHESGVVHRDLKPGNVMLTPAGVVKVLDFGLAKAGATDTSSSDANLSASPTMTYAATGAGVILGTAAYMSPEQARGKAVDRRTDIWSFGCVLYECFTGRPMFAGETVSDLIAQILRTEPDWSALPAATPPRLRKLLERCLRKDAKERLRDIGDARIELGEIAAGGVDAPAAGAASPTRGAGGAWRALAVAAVIAALALAGVLLTRRPELGPLTRLQVVSSDPDIDIGDRGNFAISPDGRSITFAMNDSAGVPHLLVRDLDSPIARVLDGTGGAAWPFWSPDSREICYFAEGNLRRIPARGGAYQNLAEVREPRGGSWARGVIIYAPDPRGPLYRVEESGGTPRAVTVLDTTGGVSSHRFPQFLPDGRHFLFSVQRSNDSQLKAAQFASLDDPHGRTLDVVGNNFIFAAPDWVVLFRDHSMVAQRIDLRTLRPTGDPVPLDERTREIGGYSESPVASASANGTMVYSARPQSPTRLSWLDPDGRLSTIREGLPYIDGNMALSPDRKRVVFARQEGLSVADLVLDLETLKLAQIAAPGQGVVAPLWDPTGTRIVGTATGRENLPFKLLDPAGGPETLLLAGSGVWRLPTSWSGTAHAIACYELVQGRGRDLRWVSLDGKPELHDYRVTPGDEADATFSHDGHWLAYWSDAAGHADLYVDRFPVPGSPRRVSIGTDMGPMTLGTYQHAWWGEGDREILFVAGDQRSVYTCTVTISPELSIGPPRLLTRLPKDLVMVDYHPAGRRFLLLTSMGSATSTLTVAQNWTRQLEAHR